MKLVDFVTNIAPHYREQLWLTLVQFQGYRFRFFFGHEPASSIRQIDFGNEPWARFSDQLNLLKNYRIRSVLVWQSGVLSNALRTESSVVILLGDMYVVSTWVAALVLQLRRRKVVFWGHGIYGGEPLLKKFVRLSFLKLANINLVYGNYSKQLLTENGFPEQNVVVVYNSLDHEQLKSLRMDAVRDDYYRDKKWFKNEDLPVLVFVGRLTKRKKLDALIVAVNALNNKDAQFNLILIGDGPERSFLESIEATAAGTIHFYGVCYEEKDLARLIANADLCVSPGEIGLTSVHSLSYGTPACTHGNFSKQMPEVEAIVEGETGTFFDESRGNLVECIEAWFGRNHDRRLLRLACYKIIDDRYNPKVQGRIIQGVLDDL